MLDVAEHQDLKAFANADRRQSRKNFEATIIPRLPRYYLIEKVRLHDFHRSCVMPRNGLFLKGPIKLGGGTGTSGFAIVLGQGGGREKFETGSARVQEQRPLQQDGERFLDEDTNEYVTLDQALTDYLTAIPSVIDTFEELLEETVKNEAP